MTLDLPEGLIANYRVQDKKVLSGILKDAWQRLNLEEKSVGIVIPEFSTFTKSLFLPSLKTQDLNEAVHWQSGDFLPLSNGKMIMDWKIVQKEGEDCQILVVAIPEDILMSFVDSAEEAGLFPLVVETPSLSLVRISNGKASGKLVVHANFGETILILAHQQKILNSSVVNSNDAKGILWTTNNMVKHYRNLEVERIEIGGLGLSKELLDALKVNFKKPIHWIEAKIEGLSADQVQEYLVPISLQFKDPAEPLDETTINLLPAKWVKLYQNKRLKLKSWTLILIISFFSWSCLLTILGIYLTLTNKVSALRKQNISQRADLPHEVSIKIQEINQISDKIVQITSVSKSPQKVINAINDLKPSGINLSKQIIDLDSGEILIKGRAADRQTLIQFKQSLESSEDFAKVNIPISTFEKEQDLEFGVTLSYLPAIAKKKITIPIDKTEP